MGLCATLMVICVFGLFTSGATRAFGQDLEEVLDGFEINTPNDSLENVLDGFQEDQEQAPPPASQKPPSPLDVSGSVSLGGSYNISHDAPRTGQADYRGLSRLKAKLKLEVEYRLPAGWKAKVTGHSFFDLAYTLKNHDGFTQDVLDAYEKEAELDEAFLQGTLAPNLDLKIGRQIVVWGEVRSYPGGGRLESARQPGARVGGPRGPPAPRFYDKNGLLFRSVEPERNCGSRNQNGKRPRVRQ